MGTFDTVYKNKLRQLEEENNKLKTALRMIFEADGDYDIIPLAPYEQDFGDAFPNSPNPSNISPRPGQFNPSPQGVPFWKWVRQLGNPTNFQQWQQWVDQWERANPGVPFGNKPGRYEDFLRAPSYMTEPELERLRDPPFKPWQIRPAPTKPGRLGRLWRAIKPLISQGPTQNNPAQTTASSVPDGNSQAEVM